MPRAAAGTRLFIRAHGGPHHHAAAREMNMGLSTPARWWRLQRRVKEATNSASARRTSRDHRQGEGHAEVVGLTGQVPDPTIVIEGSEDLTS